MRSTTRAGGAAVALAGLALLLAGCDAIALSVPSAPPPVESSTAPAAATTRTPPPPGSARDGLAALPVKGPAPLTGYQRTERFGAAWLDVDRNGCDTRDDVLRRDLVEVTATRCTVRAGELHDPYTGRTIRFVRGEGTSEAVQIDHVVALADAWRTGAQRLPQDRRVALANDPANLFAVDGPTNAAKGDGDAATWLPPRKAFRCTYVAHQVAVKRAYGLWVTPAERDAIARVLTACPDEPLPAGPTAAPVRSAAPSSAPPRAVVHPGAFCSPRGAAGRTDAGTGMTCSAGSDGRPRWRAAG